MNELLGDVKAFVRVLYGLGIVAGMQASISTMMKLGDGVIVPYLLLLVFLTFIVGCCDAILFHVSIARDPYHSWRGLVRLALDVTFPILLYVLFRTASQLELYLQFLALYFFCSILYLLLLRSWHRKRHWLLIAAATVNTAFSWAVYTEIMGRNCGNEQTLTIATATFFVVGPAWLVLSVSLLWPELLQKHWATALQTQEDKMTNDNNSTSHDHKREKGMNYNGILGGIYRNGFHRWVGLLHPACDFVLGRGAWYLQSPFLASSIDVQAA